MEETEKQNALQKLAHFVRVSRDELRYNVTWPTWKQLQYNSIVVVIAAIIFALIIFGMDKVLVSLMENIIYDLN